MSKRKLIPFVLTLGIVLIPASQAADVPNTPPVALQHIMQKLSDNMQLLSSKMYTEDWAAVARIATEVASHEEPPMAEKKQILQWLGDKAPQFRNYDLEVKAGAEDLAAAAKKEDIDGVMKALHRVQGNCLACHQSFRNDFIQHFTSNVALSDANTIDGAAPESGQRGDWLSLRQIQNKIEAADYENVRAIKRKKWGYKVKALTPEDHQVKLYIEPISGQVVYEKFKTKK